jgi:hypothetical protein
VAKRYTEDNESLNFKLNYIDLKFTSLINDLNFIVKKIIYKYDTIVIDEEDKDELDSSEYLIEDDDNKFIETDVKSLDYLYIADSDLRIENVSRMLNFTIKDYDGTFIIYKVLLDFMEDYAVGDIFLASSIVDSINDIYGE